MICPFFGKSSAVSEIYNRGSPVPLHKRNYESGAITRVFGSEAFAKEVSTVAYDYLED